MSTLPVKFDADGLIPAVIQDAESGEVLMMAYMNAEALERTRETGKTHFWSRGRKTLWQKGETSGHVQNVRSIAVNCYENCLLIRVEQAGAACHTGYPTCFFREIDANGNLVTVQERSVDPESVYAQRPGFDAVLAIWVGAYRWLADHDLESLSRTSLHLRTADFGKLSVRVADELTELAGVMVGEHKHVSPEADVVIEGSQSLYWAIVSAIRAGLSNGELIAALGDYRDVPDDDVAGLLLGEAGRWDSVAVGDVGERLRAVAALVTAAAESIQVDLTTLFEHDLSKLQTRPYLRDYFAAPPEIDNNDS